MCHSEMVIGIVFSDEMKFKLDGPDVIHQYFKHFETDKKFFGSSLPGWKLNHVLVAFLLPQFEKYFRIYWKSGFNETP